MDIALGEGESKNSCHHHILRLLREKRPDDARSFIDDQIRHRPDSAILYSLKGFVAAMTGDREESINCVNIALEMDSTDVEVIFKSAVCMRIIGRLDLVIKLLKLGVKLSDLEQVSHELFVSMRSLATLRDRFSLCRDAVLSATPRVDLSAVDRGFALAMEGGIGDAAIIWKNTILKNPNTPAALLGLGIIASDGRQLEIALEYFQLATRLQPDRAENHYLLSIALGDILHEQGSFDGVIAALKRCLELKPNWIPALERLSFAYMWNHQYKESKECFATFLRYKREQQQQSSLWSSGISLLAPYWTSNIGHYWGLESFVKSTLLGLEGHRVGILVSGNKPINRTLLSYFKNYIRVAEDPDEVERLLPQLPELSWDSEYASLCGGSLGYKHRPAAELDDKWRQAGRGPLLQLAPDHEELGWATLEKLGVPRGSWFVGVHVRSQGFYEKKDFGTHNEIRNATIESYLAGFRRITALGGYVIRMGDPSMSKLPEMDRVIDYAHSKSRSDWMDVFLWAKSRFYIATHSGPIQVPPMFDVPVIMTNMSPMLDIFTTVRAPDIAIPKLYWSERESRLLRFEECLSEPLACYMNNAKLLDSMGIQLINNTPAELDEVVSEMLERLNGPLQISKEDQELQDKFIALVPDMPLGPVRQPIGKGFLRRYQNLL